MTVWFHTTILATCVAATVAVGLASAAIYEGNADRLAVKSDRLPMTAAANLDTVTVETRSDGVSVLSRMPIDLN